MKAVFEEPKPQATTDGQVESSQRIKALTEENEKLKAELAELRQRKDEPKKGKKKNGNSSPEGGEEEEISNLAKLKGKFAGGMKAKKNEEALVAKQELDADKARVSELQRLKDLLAEKEKEILRLTEALSNKQPSALDNEVAAAKQSSEVHNEASADKDGEIARLKAELDARNQQLQAIGNRILERMDSKTQVGIALAALEALLGTERAEAEKQSFLSIKGRNKPAKVSAIEALIAALKSDNAPASEIIERVDKLHSWVLRAGVLSHRTSNCLDALISAETNADYSRRFGDLTNFEL
ncbi:MAG: hypothetical protein AB7F64_02235 [Gammaproteobacteria bacterium]